MLDNSGFCFAQRNSFVNIRLYKKARLQRGKNAFFQAGAHELQGCAKRNPFVLQVAEAQATQPSTPETAEAEPEPIPVRRTPLVRRRNQKARFFDSLTLYIRISGAAIMLFAIR